MMYLIDNYDSFSYNLYQLFASIYEDIKVIRNDTLSVEELCAKAPEALIISPGPGHPRDAGISEEAIKRLSGAIPILGICLGHQAICEAFGARIAYAKELMHGKSSLITLDTSCELFYGIKNPTEVGRYHSLAVESSSLPSELKSVAVADDGEVMAVAHTVDPTFGLQFHPESILTAEGALMAKNFIALVRRWQKKI